jgi:hypothetical protein
MGRHVRSEALDDGGGGHGAAGAHGDQGGGGVPPFQLVQGGGDQPGAWLNGIKRLPVSYR